MESTMQYTQTVSGADRTLQCFDFIAQTINDMVDNTVGAPEVDKFLLCELVKTYVSTKQYAPTLGQLADYA